MPTPKGPENSEVLFSQTKVEHLAEAEWTGFADLEARYIAQASSIDFPNTDPAVIAGRLLSNFFSFRTNQLLTAAQTHEEYKKNLSSMTTSIPIGETQTYYYSPEYLEGIDKYATDTLLTATFRHEILRMNCVRDFRIQNTQIYPLPENNNQDIEHLLLARPGFPYFKFMSQLPDQLTIGESASYLQYLEELSMKFNKQHQGKLIREEGGNILWKDRQLFYISPVYGKEKPSSNNELGVEIPTNFPKEYRIAAQYHTHPKSMFAHSLKDILTCISTNQPSFVRAHPWITEGEQTTTSDPSVDYLIFPTGKTSSTKKYAEFRALYAPPVTDEELSQKLKEETEHGFRILETLPGITSKYDKMESFIRQQAPDIFQEYRTIDLHQTIEQVLFVQRYANELKMGFYMRIGDGPFLRVK